MTVDDDGDRFVRLNLTVRYTRLPTRSIKFPTDGQNVDCSGMLVERTVTATLPVIG